MMLHNNSTIVVISLVLLACDVEKSSLGDLPESSGTETGASMESSASLTQGSQGDDHGLGAPCQHLEGEHPQSTLLTFPALTCDSLLCLFVLPSPELSSCSDDAECSDPNFECSLSEGICQPRAEYVEERSMCTQQCETADDCVTVDGTACASGYSCTVMQTLGTWCCEKVCACNDDLTTSVPSDADLQCEAGTQAGCCDRDPLPEACGTR